MTIYVDSNAGAGGNTGVDWANAFTSITSAFGAAAGEVVFVSSQHQETVSASSSINLNFTNSTSTNKVKCVSADSTSGEPPTEFKEGAFINAEASSAFITFTNHMYYNGFNFHTNSSSGDSGVQHTIFENCIFRIVQEFADRTWTFNSTNSIYEFNNCRFGFRRAGQGFDLSFGPIMKFKGCSIDSTYGDGVPPNQLVTLLASGAALIEMESCDWSGMSNTSNLVGAQGAPSNEKDGIGFRLYGNKILLASGGGITANPYTFGGPQIELYSVGSGNESYGVHIENLYGVVNHNTSVYRVGGATYNGIDGYSCILKPSIYTRNWWGPLRIKLLEKWLPANRKLSFDFVYDRATPWNDKQLWLEIQYPTSDSLNKLHFTKAVNPLGSGTPLLTSSADWVGTGGFTDVTKSKIEYQITDGSSGNHIVWACFAPESAVSAYVCPRVNF